MALAPERLDLAVAADADVNGEVDGEIIGEVDLELAARLRVALARLARQLRQQAGPHLSPTMQSVLATIALHGPLPLGELATREQVAPPTITKLLAKLDEQGLIQRERGADDKRVILVSLTPDGRRQFDESRTRRTAWLVDRLNRLDDAHQADLGRTIELLEAIVGPDALNPAPATDPGRTDPAPTAPSEPGAHGAPEPTGIPPR